MYARPGPRALICDLGFATRGGEQVGGTLAYMAPELCRGRGGLDQRTDLYALGVMLFELLTGFVPFDADTSLAVMLMQVSEPPPPLSTSSLSARSADTRASVVRTIAAHASACEACAERSITTRA